MSVCLRNKDLVYAPLNLEGKKRHKLFKVVNVILPVWIWTQKMNIL